MSIAGAGDATEAMALLDNVEAGQIVVADRGCFSHDTVRQLLERKVDFVLRLQSGVKCDVISERTLTQQDRDAGVISDQTVLLSGCENLHPPVPLRLVTIQPPPEQNDSTRDCEAPQATPELPGAIPGALPGAIPGLIRLLTSVQNTAVAAWMIGHLYRRRPRKLGHRIVFPPA